MKKVLLPMEDSECMEAWITAYIEAQSLEQSVDVDHPLWWAVEHFMEMNSLEQAEKIWLAILGVLARRPAERVLAVLAAGPLEDLLHYWGPNFIERIERAAWDDVEFRALLSGVWRSGMAEPIWERVQSAVAGRRPMHSYLSKKYKF